MDLNRNLEPLRGLRILVVEDSFLLADELDEVLTSIGCVVVGPKADLRAGLEAATAEVLDGALLDVNLSNDEDSIPLARSLEASGVPFIFVTGYDASGMIPPDLGRAPVLEKPLDMEKLAALMLRVFGDGRAGRSASGE